MKMNWIVIMKNELKSIKIILGLIVLSLLLNIILVIFFDNFKKNSFEFYIVVLEILFLVLSIVIWIVNYKKTKTTSDSPKTYTSYQLSTSALPSQKSDDIQDVYKDKYLEISEAIDSSIASYELNANGVYIKVNNEFIRILGKTPKDILGIKQKKLIDKDLYSNDEFKMMWENFEKGLPYNIKIKYNLNDSFVCFNESYSPIIKNNKLEKIIVLAVDITYLKKMQFEIQKKNNEMLATEEELRQNLEELQTTQDNLMEREFELRNTFTAIDNSFGMFEMNINKEITKANPEFLRFIKLNKENILSKKHIEIINSTEIDKDEYEMMWENFIGGLSYSMEVNYAHNENSTWLHESYTPIIKDSKIVKILVFVIDISDSKHQTLKLETLNEESIAQEEELFQNMEELASIQDDLKDRETKLVNTLDAINNTMGSYEMTLDKVIIKANEEYARTLRLDINQIENKKHNTIISEKYIEQNIYDMMWENFEGGLPFSMEIAYTKPEGEIWLHESFTPINNKGVFDKILVLTIDITKSKTFQAQISLTNKELKASEEELKQNFEELQSIQENLEEREFELSNTFSAIDNSLGMFEMNINEEIVSVNKEFLIFLKQNEEDILLKKHSDLINLKFRDEYEMMWKKVKEGLPYVMEINYKADNNSVWLHESYTPVKKDDKIVKILVLTIDISNSKHQTSKLQALNEEMSTAEEELRQNMEELKVIQENLGKREIQLRSTLDAINNTMGAYEMNIDGKITKVNETFIELLKTDKDEIINMKHIFMISTEYIDKDEYIMMWENFEGGLAYEMDVLYKTKKGDVWLHESYTPIFDQNDSFEKILVLVMNITIAKTQAIELTENSKKITKNFLEIKDIQDTLETKEAELTSTIDAIGFSTYIAEYSLSGEILEMNDAYLKLFKRQKKIMIGKNIREFSNLNNGKFDLFWDRVTSGIMEKNVFDIEHDDKRFWLSEIYAPILDKNNKPNKILAIAFDITESEKHQMLLEKQSKELEQNNKELEKLSIIARKTNNAVYILDTLGNVEWVNQGFTILYGYTIADLKQIGANVLRMSEDKEVEKNFYMCVNNGQSASFESCSKNKAGVKIWKQSNLTPIFDNYGKTVKIVGIDTDMSKNKEAEKEILKQRDLLHKKNVHISDSINYAKRIQDAILPSLELFDNHFPEHFVLFKPRDIVSGDFYWAKEVNELFIFAAADCTGHGVPGAFVSMLGISILNEIVRRKEITNGSQILQELRSQIKTMLQQTGKKDESKDGMDIAICVLRNNKIEYSGANNPLYLIREKKNKLPYISDTKKIIIHQTDNPNYTLIEYKPDKQPIGIYLNEKPFTNHTIELFDNDSIYIFSDGYVDQFDKMNNRKFLSKNFKKLLLSIADSSMSEQKQILDKTFNDWHGDANQLDDVLVMGVKI